MYDKEFIRTKTNFAKNKAAKRKGDATELLIMWTLKEGTRIPAESQQTIKKIITDYSKKLFKVRKKFRVILKDGTVKEFNRKISKDSNIIFDINLMPEDCIIEFSSKKDQVRKQFSKIRPMINYLLVNNLLLRIKPKDLISKLRLDFCKVMDGKLYIYEVKNKEKTLLEYRNIVQSLIYGVIMKKAHIPLEHITIIFNGYSKNWEDKLRLIEENYGVKIRLVNIKKWLINFAEWKGKAIDFMVFSKHDLSNYNFEVLKASEKSKFLLNIRTSKYNGFYDYKPIRLLISDDLLKIKRFIYTAKESV